MEGLASSARMVQAWWSDKGLVFPHAFDGTMSVTNLLWQHFRPLLKRAGLSPVRYHDPRYTCATLLLKQGVTWSLSRSS